MRSLLFALAIIIPTAQLGGGGVASAQEDGFQTYLQVLGGKARAAGVREATIAAELPTLTYSPRVGELDRGQPGGTGANAPAAIPNFAPYRAQHVDAARITRGRAAYAQLRPLLSRVEAQTGVPEAIMVSIFGNETNYGAYTGDFDLARALATLAYDGRRRDLFEGEFVAVLKLIDRGVPRDTLKGSWAGATGYPQFLPSMVLRLGADGDGDGRVDIWSSRADALASIANYFVQAGWRPGERWGVAVRVPSSLDRSAIRDKTTSPRCPRVHDRHSRWLTMREWRALGVTPQARTLSDTTLATLIEPDGSDATAYLLTGNYRVILDYNCSNFYALSVGLLADAVES